MYRNSLAGSSIMKNHRHAAVHRRVIPIRAGITESPIPPPIVRCCPGRKRAPERTKKKKKKLPVCGFCKRDPKSLRAVPHRTSLDFSAAVRCFVCCT